MSKKNIWCRMLGHRYQMALGGFRCARCGHFREAAWAKIPPPPKPPKPVEKRTDYEELWKNSKSVTVEKPRDFDPFGQTRLPPLATI